MQKYLSRSQYTKIQDQITYNGESQGMIKFLNKNGYEEMVDYIKEKCPEEYKKIKNIEEEK